MTKWFLGAVGAAVIAVITAWALHCFGPPDDSDSSLGGHTERRSQEPKPYRQPISFVTAKVWREGGISDEGIKGEVSRSCSGSKCEGTADISGYYPGLPKSLEIKYRCGSGSAQSETIPESLGSGRVAYKIECPFVESQP